jgi:integrase
MLAVEICSACYYVDNTLETVVGNAICADGAAAFLLAAGQQTNLCYPQIIDFETFIDTQQIEEVGLQHRDGKLRIVLGASIQHLAGPMVETALQQFTEDEEKALLTECRKSRSQLLYVAVEVALGTCMRYSEIRLLRWNQIDFAKGELRVGKAKTEHGEGRVIPLSKRVRTVLEFWAERFPSRKPNDSVFPCERYGRKGKDHVFGFAGSGAAYSTNPSKPMGSWKKAWQAAKKRAGVTCRFHDLRHTGCTRMLEAGVPFSVVSDIMGWSASTAVRMAKRYGHIGHSARRDAVDKLSSATLFDSEGAQKWAQWRDGDIGQVQ